MASKPKAPVDYNSKLYIGNELAALDRKDRGYLDSMTQEEQKKFSPFLMIRWGSVVDGDPTLQAYYLMSVNERLNKNFFEINTTSHKKLQWLMATTVSPGMGKQKHTWLAAGKKENNSKACKLLREIYPLRKEDEIELLAEITTKDQLKQLAQDHGWDDKQIKEIL
jgi:hypothetical protein